MSTPMIAAAGYPQQQSRTKRRNSAAGQQREDHPDRMQSDPIADQARRQT
jgi:hypothetical protein